MGKAPEAASPSEADGSEELTLGNWSRWMGVITGGSAGVMNKEETTKAAVEVLWSWVEKYGVPRSLYVDRKTVYITNREPTVAEQPLTQFGRACQKLGIKLVPANSAQAKNRFFQIAPQSNLPPAKNKITLQEHLHVSIHMIYRGKEIRFTEITDRPAHPHPPTPQVSAPHLEKAHIPSQDHPLLGKGVEKGDAFGYTTDSQVVGQKPIVERVNFQALPTHSLR